MSRLRLNRRTEGKQLVLLSVVTLLLAVDLVEIPEANVLAFKLQGGPHFDAVVFLAAACLYFLIIYVVALRRDWKASSYKRMPAGCHTEGTSATWS